MATRKQNATVTETPETPVDVTPETKEEMEKSAEEAEQAEALAEAKEFAELREQHGDQFEIMRKGIVELSDSGASKAKIEGFLCYAHDLSSVDAKRLMVAVIGKGRTGIGNLVEAVQLCRKRYNGHTDLTSEQKKSLVGELVKLTEAKESAILRMLSQVPFAREWAAQEMRENEATK